MTVFVPPLTEKNAMDIPALYNRVYDPYDTREHNIPVSIHIKAETTGSMKAGAFVSVPIKLTNVADWQSATSCSLNLKYDTEVFEDVVAESGELLSINPEKTFHSSVDSDAGIIKLDYAGCKDNNALEDINSGNVFAYLTFTINEDIYVDSSELQLNSKRSYLTDDNGDWYKCDANLGRITIIY